MFGLEQLERLLSNLLALGPRRLIALAVVGVAVFGAVGFGSFYWSRSDFETLYGGLTGQDVTRIGAALREGISSTSTPKAAGDGAPRKRPKRVCCSRRRLPRARTPATNCSLARPIGLTSFMQEVTRVQAEELARRSGL
jgi:flagellar M-ring protein FliF